MLRQLDVMLLFRKIHFLESAVGVLLDDHQIRGLMLQSQMNIAEAKSARKTFAAKLAVAKIAKNMQIS